MIEDIREWHSKEPDWRKARELLEEHYGYDKYGGNWVIWCLIMG